MLQTRPTRSRRILRSAHWRSVCLNHSDRSDRFPENYHIQTDKQTDARTCAHHIISMCDACASLGSLSDTLEITGIAPVYVHSTMRPRWRADVCVCVCAKMVLTSVSRDRQCHTLLKWQTHRWRMCLVRALRNRIQHVYVFFSFSSDHTKEQRHVFTCSR